MIEKQFTMYILEQSDLEQHGQLSLFERKRMNRNSRISHRESGVDSSPDRLQDDGNHVDD